MRKKESEEEGKRDGDEKRRSVREQEAGSGSVRGEPSYFMPAPSSHFLTCASGQQWITGL